MGESINQTELWIDILEGKRTNKEIVLDYLTRIIDFQYLTNERSVLSDEQKSHAVQKVIECLVDESIDDIKNMFKNKGCESDITTANIPQFSNFASATIYVPELLVKAECAYTYQKLGYALFLDAKSDAAATKYGENHGKMAALLDLAVVEKGAHVKEFKPTVLAYKYCDLDQNVKMNLLTRLCYRIPIIQYSAPFAEPEIAAQESMKKILAYSTFLRRRSNTLEVLAFALEK